MPTTALAKTIRFKRACSDGQRITVAAVGDLIFHNRLLRKAFHKKTGFTQFWRPVASVLRDADLTYGNLEGPAAQGVAVGGRKIKDPGWRLDYRVYGYRLPSLLFNFHPAVIADLKRSGFDIVSTANNHALDRGSVGIEQTIDNFDKAGLTYTGTRKTHDKSLNWSQVTRAKGLNIAWLACTFSTNGIPDRKKQTLRCFKHKERILDEIRRLHVSKDVDAVILTPHWGKENSPHPTRRQRRLARTAIEAGAAAVLGAHPHVLQPWRKHTTASGREGLIIYSLGNFVSNQRRLPQRIGTIALIEFTRAKTGEAHITGAGYIPTWVAIDRRGIRVTEGQDKSRAARHALRILPAGNRVSMTHFRQFPKNCSTKLRSTKAHGH
ncbi:MAG: CapA family protein [Hyphomicrobiaceae bacterium]